jgi:hypothetical protein
MNDLVKTRIEELKADYFESKGQPFSYFYCPILFKDEDTPLCRAHIINQAFANSSRAWTIQRKDVDNFYGSNFESDFIDIQNIASKSHFEIITDKQLSRRFHSRILVDEKPVDSFFGNQDFPDSFTEVKFDNIQTSVPFGLKMHPAEVVASQGKRWEIEISRDVRISMLVSTIKAAHLTLFAMDGYNYALSSSGIFVGQQILGEFFLKNYKKPKSDIVKGAHHYFREYRHMVRPLISGDFEGTITDRKLLMCMGSSGFPWAMMVFMRTSDIVYAALVPVFDHPDRVVTYMDFLKNENEAIQVTTCGFEQDHWIIEKGTRTMHWPKSGILYPEYPE